METLLTSDSPMEYVPKAALIVYESNKGDYLELRPILADGTMGAARGVSRKFIADAFDCVMSGQRTAPGGFMPDNILYAENNPGREMLVWYNPPQKRMRYFIDSLGLEDGEYQVPGTIYIVTNGRLYVFCYKGNGRPDETTQLLKGPFFNMYQDGKICTGSANTMMSEYTARVWCNVTKFWEDIFWKTRDAHTIDKTISTKHNLIETIRKYRTKPFNVKDLVPYGTTLQQKILSLL